MNEQQDQKQRRFRPVGLEGVVMPESALIYAVGQARLYGASKDHLEILAHQVSYLLLQLDQIARVYDQDGDQGLRGHAEAVRSNCLKKLAKILEA